MDKSFQISVGDYRKAKKDGAKSIINPSEKVVEAEVTEINGQYWLHYKTKE